ncbi:MAG: head GIN domain-containing protein [Prolixibacteraceae bacterium]|jgi:hypothetical protein|nr:head GIN domain-containing protein [Prolixibacteraceae bacterium]
MKHLTIFALIFTLIACNANSSTKMPDNWDDVDTRSYEITDFRYIHLEGGFKVILQQSDKPGLRIKADEDDFDYLDVEVRDGVLDIEIKDKHFTLDQIILYISFTELEKLHIEGGVKLETHGYIELTDFYVHVEGGAKIEMDVKATNFKVVGEGGVCFNLEGVSNSLDALVSGASYINAEDLKCERVGIRIEGIGAAYVYATNYLDARIEGVGKVTYKGEPEVHKNIGGLGFIAKN